MADFSKDEIRKLISEITEVPEAEITDDAQFFDDLGVDSMMALEIVASIEKKYNISVKAQGKGKVSVECLWWTRYDDDGIGMAKPHRTFAVKATELKDETRDITGQDTAPKEAKRAYIRIVVEEGTITVSNPSVTVAP